MNFKVKSGFCLGSVSKLEGMTFTAKKIASHSREIKRIRRKSSSCSTTSQPRKLRRSSSLFPRAGSEPKKKPATDPPSKWKGREKAYQMEWYNPCSWSP
ncbi:hypothetical protein SADUNF_Sadunf04G0151200 [Salix dunnii]|uniref:Uncharacterized protein n=1 Tax=Salix dunnii TaxID=1413687 RepID=A0A835N178_9ROSI|nr:hypothetical protein SADUNF_Sadunf04G0151200 [Salix dunnii]